MIHWKYYFWGLIGISFVMDVFEEGFMTVGIIAGWLVGLMTATYWDIEYRNKRRKRC